MKLVLVRHGRPDEEDREQPHDPPLRADGWRQARAAAAVLAGEGITRIIASPLQRAQQTALPLAERLGLPVEIMEGWAEADRHLDRYRSNETLRAQGEAEWARFLQDPLAYMGADAGRFRADVLGALQALARHDPQAHVVVFTHGLPINLVLAHALGLAGLVNFPPHYGSLTRLRVQPDGRLAVTSVNETVHHRLPDAFLETPAP